MSRAADRAVGIMGPEGSSLPERLRDLTDQVEQAMELRVCWGAMLALAIAQLRSGHDLR